MVVMVQVVVVVWDSGKSEGGVTGEAKVWGSGLSEGDANVANVALRASRDSKPSWNYQSIACVVLCFIF